MTIFEQIVAIVIPVLSMTLTAIYSLRPAKQKTSRLMYEKCYYKIQNTFMDYEFRKINFSELITSLKALVFQAEGYCHPELIQRAYMLSIDDNIHSKTYKEFVNLFQIEFALTSMEIGIPTRIITIPAKPNGYSRYRYWKFRFYKDYKVILFLYWIMYSIFLIYLLFIK